MSAPSTADSHTILAAESARYNCGNWWTQSNSQVKRSIFMDDYVYSVALDRINISSLDDLEHPVASVSLLKSAP